MCAGAWTGLAGARHAEQHTAGGSPTTGGWLRPRTTCTPLPTSQPKRPARDHTWGRFSYGTESTVVVCVDTLPAARIRLSSDSRCVIVGTCTLSR